MHLIYPMFSSNSVNGPIDALTPAWLVGRLQPVSSWESLSWSPMGWEEEGLASKQEVLTIKLSTLLLISMYSYVIDEKHLDRVNCLQICFNFFFRKIGTPTLTLILYST